MKLDPANPLALPDTITVELLDDDGKPIITLDLNKHICAPDVCEEPAYCEQCGARSTDICPIYIGATEDGMNIFACPYHVEDKHCRIKREQ